MPASKDQNAGLEAIATAIGSVFESPAECDSNFEHANVVDGLFAVARAIQRLASAVEKLSYKEEPGPDA